MVLQKQDLEDIKTLVDFMLKVYNVPSICRFMNNNDYNALNNVRYMLDEIHMEESVLIPTKKIRENIEYNDKINKEDYTNTMKERFTIESRIRHDEYENLPKELIENKFIEIFDQYYNK